MIILMIESKDEVKKLPAPRGVYLWYFYLIMESLFNCKIGGLNNAARLNNIVVEKYS
jgi:hypothetical protein